MRVLDGFSGLVVCLNIVNTDSFSNHSPCMLLCLEKCSLSLQKLGSSTYTLRNEQVDFLFHDLRPIVRKRHQ